MPSVKLVRLFDGTTKNVHVDQQEANGELKCIGLEEKKAAQDRLEQWPHTENRTRTAGARTLRKRNPPTFLAINFIV